jgi:flagellar protein FliO/FliZ
MRNKRWQQLLRFLTIFTLILVIGLISPVVQLSVHAGTDDNKSVSDALKENQKKEDKGTNEENDAPSPLLVEEGEATTVDHQFSAFDFFNVIFALFLVLMLLYVTLRFIKKKNQTYTYTKTMMNLGGTSLGGNRSVQLVKIGDRILILGVGEDIQLLKEIDSDEEVEQILTSQQNEVQQMLQPSDLVSKILGQVKALRKENQVADDSFKSILSKQLSELSNGRKKMLQEIDRKGKRNDE